MSHDRFILEAQGVVRRFGAFTAVDVESYYESVVVWFVKICGLIFVEGDFVVGTR